MSIVAKQSFKYTIIGYLGFLLGTFSAIFVFPLNLEFYGKLRFIMNSAEVIAPFIILGISYSNVKFFYQSQKENKHHNILSLSLLAVMINFFIFLIGFGLMPFIFPEIKELKIWEYKFYVIPLVLILSICAIFNKFTSNYKRVAVSNIFDNLFPKLANVLSFSLFFFLGVSQLISFGVFISIFIISMLGYIYYANHLEKIKYNFSTEYIKKDALWKSFISYSFFGFLGTFGNQLNINNQMIGEFLGMEEVGIYSILYSLISLISIPQLGVFNVSAPIINQNLSEKKYEELDIFYKKTSLSLFFLGAVLFACIVSGFPYLTSMMKNGNILRDYQPVIWIWGSAVLFDLATGFNGNIISLSKYYKFNIIVMLILAIFTITLNYYFINNTDLKLIGIAISTAISLCIYNGIKVLFNYWKFKVSPFSMEMVFATIICSLAISLAMILPDFNNSFINMIYKPLSVLIFIFIGNSVMKIIDLKDFYQKLLKKNK